MVGCFCWHSFSLPVGMHWVSISAPKLNTTGHSVSDNMAHCLHVEYAHLPGQLKSSVRSLCSSHKSDDGTEGLSLLELRRQPLLAQWAGD